MGSDAAVRTFVFTDIEGSTRHWQAAPDAAELVDMLLDACRDASIVATSREPLGVDGEVVWRRPRVLCAGLRRRASPTIAWPSH